MDIVAAGMHDSRNLRFVGKIVVLFYRKRVDIGAEGNAGPGLAALKNADGAGSGKTVRDGDAHF